MSFQINKQVILLLVFFTTLNFIGLADNYPFKIVTWNLENMMSKQNFEKWTSYCSKHNWASISNMSEGIGYCDAHNGKDFITKKKISLELRTWDKFMTKVKVLKERAKQLNADIYAFQEISDIEALKLILEDSDYHLFSTNFPTSQNLGFAVKKNLPLKISFYTVEDLAINQNLGYVTKPAAELLVRTSHSKFKILNLHLKSGCKYYIIDKPSFKSKAPLKRKEYINKSCKILRKQLPVLKNWVINNNNQRMPFIILGDFNRSFTWEFNQFFNKKTPARLQNSDSLSLGSTITPKTKLAFMFFELSYSKITFEQLVISFSKREVKRYMGKSRCLYNNDHIIYNKRFLTLSTEVIDINEYRIAASSTDYGDENYALNKAAPSDHCPVVASIHLKM